MRAGQAVCPTRGAAWSLQ